MWSLETGELVYTLPESANNRNTIVRNAVFAPDGRWIIGSEGEGLVAIWDLKHPLTKTTRKLHDDHIRKISISGDGGRILTTASDGTAKVHDTKTWACRLELPRAYGLLIQGCCISRCHPDSTLTEKTRALLGKYGAK